MFQIKSYMFLAEHSNTTVNITYMYTTRINFRTIILFCTYIYKQYKQLSSLVS